eukprot:NODE_8011_length_429_cov_8.723684_g7552_i0.p1 GENE.NODE_8011_length_429_cov_8.723684_g7552_i0~~NODE_8011_length_429_cov_8.723684_g7552_i0.p1  ORF type:complete len:102 (-),score=9.02 NODE_8011_length_429_cov_8.723684_g7552_i0:68-373(-)
MINPCPGPCGYIFPIPKRMSKASRLNQEIFLRAPPPLSELMEDGSEGSPELLHSRSGADVTIRHGRVVRAVTRDDSLPKKVGCFAVSIGDEWNKKQRNRNR